ncbi:MAG: hypothetical protein Q9166_002618 [cf. Caloplaca sp. 2 TL-2023]
MSRGEIAQLNDAFVLLSTLTRTTLRHPSSHSSTLLCTQCHSALRSNDRLPRSCPPTLNHQRHPFTTTPIPHKKQGGKGNSKNTVAVNASKTSHDNTDPTDFSSLQTEIDSIVEKLREEIRNIKAGGINIEAVEDARVIMKSGGGGGKQMVRVRDLCQVVPRGRVLVLMVGEKAHIKSLTSTLSSPPLNLTPQSPSSHTSPNSTQSPTSSQQSLELHIPIPPTTTESRLSALNLVSTRGEHALFALREERGAQKKRLRQLELARKIGPDMLRRAERKLEKVNEGGMGTVKKVVEERRRALGEG